MINPWLTLADTFKEAEYNLICLPFAGGYGEYYLPWRALLPENIRLCPIQLPGRSARWQEPVLTDMQELIHQMLPAVTNLIYERPYLIFGHSMGGYIAYALCLALIEKKMPLPELLFVSAIPAPCYWHTLHKASDFTEQEFSSFFIKLGGFAPELMKHESFIKLQMALLRQDIILTESCRYQAPAEFPFPIVALGGDNDEHVMIESMDHWRLETKNDFALHKMPGNHFYLNHHLPTIIELMQRQL